MFSERVLRAAAWVIAAFLLAVGTPASAQSMEDSHSGEVAALGGAGFGGGASGIGTQPAVSGSSGLSFSRYGMALANVMFMPLGHHTIQGWPDRATVDRSYLWEFGVDVHIRFPIGRHWVPYAIAGGGLMWNIVHQNTVNKSGSPVSPSFNQFNGAGHTGGGLRYYVTENWGIRPEVKVILSKQTYTTVSFGVFYVLPGNFP